MADRSPMRSSPLGPRVFLFGAGASKHLGYPLIDEIYGRAQQVHAAIRAEGHWSGNSEIANHIAGFVEAWAQTSCDDLQRRIDHYRGASRTPTTDTPASKTSAVAQSDYTALLDALACELSDDAESIRNFEFFLTYLEAAIQLETNTTSESAIQSPSYATFCHDLILGAHYLVPEVITGKRSSDAITRLLQCLQPSDTIITTNYDLILERSLIHTPLWSPITGYGIERVTSGGRRRADGTRLPKRYFRPSTVQLLKLNGSLNWTQPGWYRSPAYLGFWIEFGDVDPSLADVDDMAWQNHENELSRPGQYYLGFVPAIIPPLRTKRFGAIAPQMAEIHERAQESLSKARSLIAIGYSFPYSDHDVCRYTDTAIQDGALDEIIVVNPDKSVTDKLADMWGDSVRITAVDARAESSHEYLRILQ